MPKTSAASTDEALRKCQRECKARCCRYFTVQIPAPKLKSDFDELSWFLAHNDVRVYVESRRWHVEVQNRCKHLSKSNLCAAYEKRPDVCSGYDIEACEYPERPAYDLYFSSQTEFDAWWAKKREREGRRRRARAAKSRRSRPAAG
jgi:Fe-S-cluster containining protein